MKPSLLILSAAAILCAAAAASSLLAAPPSTPASKPHQVVLYGHVKSIAQKNHRFVMRFDPAWWLTGPQPSVRAAAARCRTTTTSSTRAIGC